MAEPWVAYKCRFEFASDVLRVLYAYTEEDVCVGFLRTTTHLDMDEFPSERARKYFRHLHELISKRMDLAKARLASTKRLRRQARVELRSGDTNEPDNVNDDDDDGDDPPEGYVFTQLDHIYWEDTDHFRQNVLELDNGVVQSGTWSFRTNLFGDNWLDARVYFGKLWRRGVRNIGTMTDTLLSVRDYNMRVPSRLPDGSMAKMSERGYRMTLRTELSRLLEEPRFLNETLPLIQQRMAFERAAYGSNESVTEFLLSQGNVDAGEIVTERGELRDLPCVPDDFDGLVEDASEARAADADMNPRRHAQLIDRHNPSPPPPQSPPPPPPPACDPEPVVVVVPKKRRRATKARRVLRSKLLSQPSTPLDC